MGANTNLFRFANRVRKSVAAFLSRVSPEIIISLSTNPKPRRTESTVSVWLAAGQVVVRCVVEHCLPTPTELGHSSCAVANFLGGSILSGRRDDPTSEW